MYNRVQQNRCYRRIWLRQASNSCFLWLAGEALNKNLKLAVVSSLPPFPQGRKINELSSYDLVFFFLFRIEVFLNTANQARKVHIKTETMLNSDDYSLLLYYCKPCEKETLLVRDYSIK